MGRIHMAAACKCVLCSSGKTNPKQKTGKKEKRARRTLQWTGTLKQVCHCGRTGSSVKTCCCSWCLCWICAEGRAPAWGRWGGTGTSPLSDCCCLAWHFGLFTILIKKKKVCLILHWKIAAGSNLGGILSLPPAIIHLHYCWQINTSLNY